MNKLKIKFVIPTCLLLIQRNIQVLSQNQSLYRFVINKKEQQAKIALLTLVKEELHNVEYKVDFNLSSMLGLQPGIDNYFLTEIYLNKNKYL